MTPCDPVVQMCHRLNIPFPFLFLQFIFCKKKKREREREKDIPQKLVPDIQHVINTYKVMTSTIIILTHIYVRETNYLRSDVKSQQ